MKVLLVGSAPTNEKLLKVIWKRNDVLVAADGGADTCLRAGLHPQFVVGDLDSISLDAKNNLNEKSIFEVHPTDKDYTDLYLAKQKALSLGASSLNVLGWADDKIDYSLSAIHVFEDAPVSCELFTDTARVVILNEHRRVLHLKSSQTKKCSVYPIRYPVSVISRGLRWDIEWIKTLSPK